MHREIEIGHFICLRTENDVKEPFYIAQVLSRDDDNQKFKIHWWEPTSASRARTGLFESMFYQEEWDNKKVKGFQKNGRKYKLIPRIQDIDWDQCCFGFSKLKSSGALPAEVLRQLRINNLITGKIKRS
jgi:hypothetical protein